MPVVKVFDESGTPMTLVRYHGNRYGASDFCEETLKRMKEVKLERDDVVLCSYSKSGCHWMWETVRMLEAGTTNVPIVEKEDFMMEFRTLTELEAMSKPRVLNNHMPWDNQPLDLVEKNVKIVFFYRNLKDVAVSFYHHHLRFNDYEYQGSFPHYIKRLVQGKVDNGSPFEYLKGWDQAIKNNPHLPIFVGSYEDMKQRPLQELRRLSSFLGRHYNDCFLEEVMEMTSFESMKIRKGPASFQDDEGEPIAYRKGEVGDWVNYFSMEENQWFDNLIEEHLSDTMFRFTYSINTNSSNF